MDAEYQTVPEHIAIIMDGNGRWAHRRNLPRLVGHRAGTRHICEIAAACITLGVRYLTLYAFSTENWGRPRDEVEGMINVLRRFVDTDIETLHHMGVQLRHLGREERIDEILKQKVRAALHLTRRNSRLTLAIAFNYGGRADMLDAVRAMIADGIAPHEVNETMIAAYLSTSGIPDPDLVIRTSGEQRISNFLLWQTAHSEYWATETFWPDFRAAHLYQAVQVYAERKTGWNALAVGVL